ncbi:MAG: POTRA domain-containing protein, partial [Hyphomonadaceae bacterium]
MQSAAAARALGLAYGACVLAAAPAALAQDGLFVDRNRLDTAPPGAQPAPPPRGPAASAPAQAAPEMTLAGVSIAGESDPAALDAIAARAAPLRGRPLTRETLQALLDAVAAHYAAQDIAFSRAFAPPQDFAEGRVRLVV